jgi:hypothetical protein
MSIITYAGRLGWVQTILGALLVGLFSAFPAWLKFPTGVIILPFLALLLGVLSRSRVGLILSGAFTYFGHISVLYLAVTAIGGNKVGWENLSVRMLIDFFFLGWWFAIIPISGLGWLGRTIQKNCKVPLVFLSLFLAGVYAFILVQFVKPDISTSYELTGFLLSGEQGLSNKATLTLPLPVVDGVHVPGLKPCGSFGDQYTMPVTSEKIVDSDWGPAWQAQLGPSTITNFNRCPDLTPHYPDIIPLKFVLQKQSPQGRNNGPLKLTNDGNTPLNLTLILYTKGSNKQTLSPFSSIRLVWSSYIYEERMDIKKNFDKNWQVSPILPGTQTEIMTIPYIEILPFG